VYRQRRVRDVGRNKGTGKNDMMGNLRVPGG